MSMQTREERKVAIDLISKVNGYGSISSAQMNNIAGINLNLNGTPAPRNQDSHGITFFTRPDLNLSDENLAMSRMLSPLIGSKPDTMATAIKAMLDPRGNHQSGIFNNQQAFIPLLTNNLLSASGFPDLMVDTYTSKEGNYKESWSMVDGTAHIFNTYDISTSFRNIQGDPITLLLMVWTLYSSLVYEGVMVPYPDNVLENRIDYNTRIYRLVLDSDWRYVQKIASTGASFPVAAPTGAAFNYSDDAEYNTENDQISTSFRCMGFTYLDPIVVSEFNASVYLTNPTMTDSKRNSKGGLIKISSSVKYGPGGKYGYIGSTLLNMLSHKCYPRIEPNTYELEWWANSSDFVAAINELIRKGLLTI